MEELSREQSFFEALRGLMAKHGVSIITMTTEQGCIYFDVNDNYFSAEEATIRFE